MDMKTRDESKRYQNQNKLIKILRHGWYITYPYYLISNLLAMGGLRYIRLAHSLTLGEIDFLMGHWYTQAEVEEKLKKMKVYGEPCMDPLDNDNDNSSLSNDRLSEK